jgi:hypothetical protein
MIGGLGFVVLNAGFAFAGVAILIALGWVPLRARDLAASLGLAFLTGLCAVLIVGVGLVAAGVTFSMPVCVGVSAVLGAAALLVARRRSTAPAGHPAAPLRTAFRPRGLGGVLVVGLGIVTVAWLAVLGFDAAFHPLDTWDGWAIWANKGVMLSSLEAVPPPFASDAYTYMHRDYPIFLPLLESLTFRAVGSGNTQIVHLELWLLLVAFCGGLAFLARRRLPPILSVSLVLAVVLAPGIWDQLLTGYADVPMALLLCIGVLLLGLWLVEREDRQVVLATLFLAAAASTKNEGATAAVFALVMVALVMVAAREWSALGRVALAGAGFALMVLPWRIWTQAHDISSHLPVGKGLTPGYLADRADRVWPSMSAFEDQLSDASRWSYLVPIAIAVVAFSLYASFRSRAPANTGRVALFYLLTGIGCFLLITWAFTITTDPLDWQIGTSASRVVSGVVLVSVAAIFQLGGMIAQATEKRARQDSNL